MNKKMKLLALLLGAVMFAGCDSSGKLLDDDNDVDHLIPEEPPAVDPNAPRPSEATATMTTGNMAIWTVNGDPIFPYGVSLNYEDPVTHFDAIAAIAQTDAQWINLLITKETDPVDLQDALLEIYDNNMGVIVSFADPSVLCNDDDDAFFAAVEDYWLGEFLPTIAQDRFQERLIINIAKGWGPASVFDPSSSSYGDYIDNYKWAIRKFRDAGFNLPLVIDAPACGEDYFAFLTLRGVELMNSDTGKNLVLGVNAVGSSWESETKVVNALTALYTQGLPVVFTGIAGSGVGEDPINESDIIDLARGDYAMGMNIPWESGDDGVGYLTSLGDTPLDLSGGQVALNYYLSQLLLEQQTQGQNVIQTGELTVGAYLRDVNGNGLRLTNQAAKSTRLDAWNLLRASVTDEFAAEDLLEGSTEFDVTQVTGIGIEVLANGKAADVMGIVEVDDLIVYPGVAPMFDAQFTDGQDGFGVGWGSVAVTHDAANGALSILPQGPDFAVQLNQPGQYGIDFTKTLDVTIRMMVPADMDPSGLWMNLYGQFADDWSIWKSVSLPTGVLVAGQWAEMEVEVDFHTDNAGVNIAQTLGMQMGGFSGTEANPILVDFFIVEDPSAKPTKTIEEQKHLITFSSGTDNFYPAVATEKDWVGAAVTEVSAQDEAMAITPDVSTGSFSVVMQDTIFNAADLNFEGNNTVSVDVFVPASFTGTELALKVFLQDGASWSWWETAPQGFDNFVVGDWATLTFDLSSLPDGFARNLPPHRVGLIFENLTELAGESLLVDNIDFTGDVEVEDLQPIWSNDFSESDETVSDFTVDYTLGGLNNAAAETAKGLYYKVIPFSWSADTWFGNPDGLDITNTVDMVDLTDRGQIIVDGFQSPQDTSQPAQ